MFKITNYILGVAGAALIISLPLAASAASVSPGVAEINLSALTSFSSKPIISGTASGVKTVQFNIYKGNSSKILFKSKKITVRNGTWKATVSKKLPNASYKIKVYGPKGLAKNLLATETLLIDTTKKNIPKPATTFVVQSLPLLAGGVVHQGQSVPVAYLQVTNIGANSAVLKGFTVQQTGSAPVQAVIGLSTVDETGTLRASTGGVEGQSPFVNGFADVPTPDILIAAGVTKLFTIKATMTGYIIPYINSQLILDVAGVNANADFQVQFPIRGTIWTLAR